MQTKALASLLRMNKAIVKFDAEWNEVIQAGLPSCWDNTTNTLYSLLAYEGKLKVEMNHTDTVSEKTTLLKAEMIIAALGKKFHLLHHVKYWLPTQMNYVDLTETHLLVEAFSAIPEHAGDTWQRCFKYANRPVTAVTSTSTPSIKKKVLSTTSTAPVSSANFATPIRQKK